MNRTRVLGTVLLLMAALLSGCLGGDSAATEEAQIHKVLDRYELAMKDKSAEGIADLIVLPIYIEGIRLDREQFVEFLELAFLFIEVHEFQVTQRHIRINGDSAVVEGVLQSKGITWGEPFEDEEEIVLELKKVGGAWKLSTTPGLSD